MGKRRHYTQCGREPEVLVARAHSIFVVVSAVGRQRPIAAFTVKHELKTWLVSRTRYDNPVHIFRLKDGQETEAPDVMTAESFMQQEERING